MKFPWLGDDGADARALGDAAHARTPTTTRASRCCPRSTRRWSSAFEAGDLRRPYIVGACWNGKETLPESPAQPNNKRLIKTRSGSLLEFDDTDGAAKVTVSMQSGHKLVLDDAAQEVTLTHSNGCDDRRSTPPAQIADHGELDGRHHRLGAQRARRHRDLRRHRQLHDADRLGGGRLALLHAGRGEHLVMRDHHHDWMLVAPWYRWPRAGAPSCGRRAARARGRVIQKYDDPNFVDALPRAIRSTR